MPVIYNISLYEKSLRMSWTGSVTSMGVTSNAYRNFVGNSEANKTSTQLIKHYAMKAYVGVDV
jgi:hypothetical protein